jgi:oxalate decarboxylase/phosphoglucose isomerase-like protein (cupin superfamily)
MVGEATFTAGDQTIRAKAGDFIHIPRGTVHSLRGTGTKPGRALIIISPAGPTGMQQFFEQSFTPATDRNVSPPTMDEALMQRMMQAASRNGLEWVRPQ